MSPPPSGDPRETRSECSAALWKGWCRVSMISRPATTSRATPSTWIACRRGEARPRHSGQGVFAYHGDSGRRVRQASDSGYRDPVGEHRLGDEPVRDCHPRPGRLPVGRRVHYRTSFWIGSSSPSVLEAEVLAEEYRVDHNQEGPHSSVRYLTPAEFAARCAPRVPLPRGAGEAFDSTGIREKMSMLLIEPGTENGDRPAIYTMFRTLSPLLVLDPPGGRRPTQGQAGQDHPPSRGSHASIA